MPAGENRCLLLLRLEGEGECEVTTVTGRHIRRRFVTPESVGDLALLALHPDTDFAGDYSFVNRFSQTVAVTVRHGDAEASTTVQVFDLQQLGSLYERIVERVVKPDTARQAPGHSHTVHPWFPVLLIGAHKAELYTRALVGDVVHKRQNLADPGWLMRVGLYLELMTALGVIEAVRDDLGDLLTPEERAAADSSRTILTINVEGWRERVGAAQDRRQPRIGHARTCWPSARRRSSSCTSTTRTSSTRSRSPGRTARTRRRPGTACSATPSGPCCARRPTRSRSSSTCRRKCGASCSGTGAGSVGLSRVLRVPGPLPRLVGDQDGLFASACNQYRASMNHVADWAAEQGLMDHAGGSASRARSACSKRT